MTWMTFKGWSMTCMAGTYPKAKSMRLSRIAGLSLSASLKAGLELPRLSDDFNLTCIPQSSPDRICRPNFELQTQPYGQQTASPIEMLCYFWKSAYILAAVNASRFLTSSTPAIRDAKVEHTVCACTSLRPRRSRRMTSMRFTLVMIKTQFWLKAGTHSLRSSKRSRRIQNYQFLFPRVKLDEHRQGGLSR